MKRRTKILEIRNYQREEPNTSPKTEDDSSWPSKHENGSSSNKYALDYMPRFVIKQMNERRSLNTTMISASNRSLNGGGSSVMGLRDAVENNSSKGITTITTTITPYNLYNAKNANELVESTTKELNRRSSGKSNKIHSKMTTNIPSSSSSSNSQKQHQKVINSAIDSGNSAHESGQPSTAAEKRSQVQPRHELERRTGGLQQQPAASE
jgi:hypothetical protein